MVIARGKRRAGLPAAAFLLSLFVGQMALGQTVTSPTAPPSTDGGGGINNPPVLLSLNAQQVPGKKYRISGRVADETPINCGVVITGAASGVAMCNAEGYFDAIFNVATPGTIYAVVGDGQTQSGASMLLLTNGAPAIAGFRAVQGPGNTWTFSGTATDEAVTGLNVSLTGPPGVNGLTATVFGNGAWSITVTLPEGTSGNVTATVTDWYGLTGAGYTSF